MQLPGGLTLRGAPFYVLYTLVGAHLPYRPSSSRRIRARMVHAYAPKVHPDSVINKRARIAPGATIMQGAGVGEGSFVPSHVTLHRHVMMGPGCLFLTGDHPVPRDGGYFGDYASVFRPIVVEEDVFIGARVIVLPGVTIGRGAAVGAGAVVSKDVPPGATVVGNPARVVRKRVPPPPLGDKPYPGKRTSPAKTS